MRQFAKSVIVGFVQGVSSVLWLAIEAVYCYAMNSSGFLAVSWAIRAFGVSLNFEKSSVNRSIRAARVVLFSNCVKVGRLQGALQKRCMAT